MQVGSRVVIQVGGALMMFFGMMGKFGALFVTIPDPVIGGLFMVMFGNNIVHQMACYFNTHV